MKLKNEYKKMTRKTFINFLDIIREDIGEMRREALVLYKDASRPIPFSLFAFSFEVQKRGITS